MLTDHASSLLLCSSEAAAETLRAEQVVGAVEVVGDVMVDVFELLAPRADEAILENLGVERGGYLLATAHRAGNVDDPARLRALVDVLTGMPLPVVLPLHPRTRARLADAGLLDALDGVIVAPPLGYLEFTGLVLHARAVLTDSGGVQKEAYLAGVPCITLRVDDRVARDDRRGLERARGPRSRRRAGRAGAPGPGRAAAAVRRRPGRRARRRRARQDGRRHDRPPTATSCIEAGHGDRRRAVEIQDGAVLGKSPTLARSSTAPRADARRRSCSGRRGHLLRAIVFAGARSATGAIIGDQAYVRERATIGDGTRDRPRLLRRQRRRDRRAREGPDRRLPDGVLGRRGRRLRRAGRVHDQRRHDEPPRQVLRAARRRCSGARAGSAAARCSCPGVEIGEEAFVAAGAVSRGMCPPRRSCMGVPRPAVVREVAGRGPA